MEALHGGIRPHPGDPTAAQLQIFTNVDVLTTNQRDQLRCVVGIVHAQMADVGSFVGNVKCTEEEMDSGGLSVDGDAVDTFYRITPGLAEVDALVANAKRDAVKLPITPRKLAHRENPHPPDATIQDVEHHSPPERFAMFSACDYSNKRQSIRQ